MILLSFYKALSHGKSITCDFGALGHVIFFFKGLLTSIFAYLYSANP